MIKYTDGSFRTLYDYRSDVITSDVEVAFEVIKSLNKFSDLDTIKKAAQQLMDACNGIGVYEVEIKNTLVQETFTNSDKYPTYTKSNPNLTIIDEIPPIEPKNNLKEDFTLVDDSCLKPITDINVGQENDAELGDAIENNFKVGDTAIIDNVAGTELNRNTVGLSVIIVHPDGDIIGVQFYNDTATYGVTLDNLSRFKVGDRVEVVNVDNTPYDTETYKGIRGSIINICSVMRPITIKVGDAEYYFNVHNLRKL